jgi:hypothetical protein
MTVEDAGTGALRQPPQATGSRWMSATSGNTSPGRESLSARIASSLASSAGIGTPVACCLIRLVSPRHPGA